MNTASTRRAVLAGAAAIPALSLPALAATPDPVFAAIDLARVTYSVCGDLLRKHGDWDNEPCTKASDDWDEAHRTAFQTVPTSRAGALALIAFALECAHRDGIDAIGDYYDGGDRPVLSENSIRPRFAYEQWEQ